MKYLYLHGLGQNADSWNQVTRAAEELDNSVCVDLAKMVKGKKVTYSTLYSTFSEMCDSENEGITLCGLSLGGVLALNYAIDHPQKVKALVLIAAQYKMPVRLLKLQNALFRFMPQSMFQQTGFGSEVFGLDISVDSNGALATVKHLETYLYEQMELQKTFSCFSNDIETTISEMAYHICGKCELTGIKNIRSHDIISILRECCMKISEG